MTPEADSTWVSVSREAASFAASLTLLVLGIVFLIGAIRLDFGSVTMPGPGMFPTLAAALLTLLTAIMTVRSFRSLRERTGLQIGLGHSNSVLAAALLAVMAAVFEPLGIAISAFVFVAALALLFTRRRWWAACLFAAALTCGVVLIFERLLEVSLPAGILRLF